MGSTLPNFTAPDEFGADGELKAPNTVRVRLSINNQAIWWRRGRSPAGGGGIYWEPEEFLPPGVYSFVEDCEAIQVRAAVPAANIPPGGLQAQVSIATRTPGELHGGS